jgi:DNA (cytosine-5)-methyltransferase 1
MNQLLQLRVARERFGDESVASAFGVSGATMRRWERSGVPSSRAVDDVLTSLEDLEARPLRIVDLFAGIGGVRLGFEQEGYKCVYTSEWDKYARQTYAANFGEAHAIAGDITEVAPADVPEHDVLLAGFPCQPFSLAGVSKKNSLGRPHGFDDPNQGNLFFNVRDIIEAKRPSAFVLENVRNLRSHDGGRTFQRIMVELRALDYSVSDVDIDGDHFVPQRRRRIAIVGFRSGTEFSSDSLNVPPANHTLREILHREDGSEPELPWDEGRYFDHTSDSVKPNFIITPRLWRYLRDYAAKHRAAGNGFGYSLVGPDDVARTLSARYHKDGSEILISRDDGRPRRLTPRECARLMGFPDEFVIPVSNTQAYRQFGNSVIVPAFGQLAKAIWPRVEELRYEVSRRS